MNACDYRHGGREVKAAYRISQINSGGSESKEFWVCRMHMVRWFDFLLDVTQTGAFTVQRLT